jgi:hypothetical protein
MYIVKFGMMMFHASRWAEVSNYYLLCRQHVFHHHLHPGGAENEKLDLVERLGIIGNACRMDVMVGAKTKPKKETFTH